MKIPVIFDPVQSALKLRDEQVYLMYLYQSLSYFGSRVLANLHEYGIGVQVMREPSKRLVGRMPPPLTLRLPHDRGCAGSISIGDCIA